MIKCSSRPVLCFLLSETQLSLVKFSQIILKNFWKAVRYFSKFGSILTWSYFFSHFLNHSLLVSKIKTALSFHIHSTYALYSHVLFKRFSDQSVFSSFFFLENCLCSRMNHNLMCIICTTFIVKLRLDQCQLDSNGLAST